MDFHHVSVLLAECLEGLQIQSDGIYLDGTAGGAGHSCAIASKLQTGRLIALDQDPDAICVAKERLANLPATVVQSNFRFTGSVLKQLGIAQLDGALLDLGVSSHQLDERERGFSYLADAPLDMRMSQSGLTAAQFIAQTTRQELAKILRDYGEENYAWQIAGKIEYEQAKEPIVTTARLAEIVANAVPPAVRRKDKHPARKTFQALRIAVNHEFDALMQGMDEIFACLRPGGRFCIITFHSLEDRIVKQQFKKWATACTCPPEIPVCVCKGQAKAKLITRKPIEASKQEQAENRRARSAKLRIIEKL